MEEKNAWNDYKITKQEPNKKSDESSPIESLFTSPDPYTEPESFAEATQKKRFGLAKAWHISAVILSIVLIICGIVAASATENGLTFFVYLIAAFFAYMISETIAAVINWLVSKK